MSERSKLKVRDIMQTDVHTLGRNDKLSVADELMRSKEIRHVPVIDEDGKVCAIVSQRSLYRGALLKAMGYGSHMVDKLFDNYRVKEAMSNELHTTTPETPIHEAASAILEHKIGCLPVLDDRKLIGIVTKSDFLKLAADSAG
ncbi:MAG: CBS domain-containing protein [Gammaproteobacteria bacterium]|nr:CBS domain-containing protein [Gammaproteobacteria bacterium]